MKVKKNSLKCYDDAHNRYNKLFDLTFKRNEIWGSHFGNSFAEAFIPILNVSMKFKIVLVSCTNVGRHMINLFLENQKFKNIELSGVLNLNFSEGLKNQIMIVIMILKKILM